MTEGSRALAFGRFDSAGLAAFRVFFGVVMTYVAIRFWANGWISEIYLAPDYHFTYALFPWVRPLPSPALHVLFVIIIGAAIFIALGAWTRWAAAVFFLTFTYAELIEKAAYLNHYYLVSLLAFLLIFVPSDRCFSVRPSGATSTQATVSNGAYWILRAQIAFVYTFAGIAKLNSDWLLRAEPLKTWLQGFTHLPLIGDTLSSEPMAFLMSWVGAFFDLTIWLWLLWPRTRTVALVVAVVFHITVWLLFPIGVFSWVMLVSLTLFLPPNWPRQALTRLGLVKAESEPSPSDTAPQPPRRTAVIACALWIAIQVFVPLRHLAYPGPVNWTEEGFRFGWRVMLIEKTGTIEYRLETFGPRKSFRINPREKLTPLQFKMLSTQPDMIIQYAQHLAKTAYGDGYERVEVYADSYVSFNGRLSQRYIDPTCDLSAPHTKVSEVIVPLLPGP